MNIVMRAARDCVGAVGSAYVAFSLYRLIAWPGHDFIVAPSEKYLGLTAIGIFVLLACVYSAAGWMTGGRGREQAKAGVILNKESGNVLFLILIAVTLFAALSYAVTRMGRTPVSTIEDEKAELSQAEIDSYTAALNTGKMRLELINGCKSIDYTPPADQVAGDKFCHMYHPSGGGVAYRDFGDTCPSDDILANLAIGGRCGALVYAGESGGNRLYTTLSDLAPQQWGPNTITGATSNGDGLANTNTLIALGGHPAAEVCRALGKEWYLPAPQELNTLFSNIDTIGGFSFSGYGNHYWASMETTSSRASQQDLVTGSTGNTSARNKNRSLSVRCVRR